MKANGRYENEVEKPSLPQEGRMLKGMGCDDFKAQADPIAYGQAGGNLYKQDMGKIMGQMKQYHWD